MQQELHAFNGLTPKQQSYFDRSYRMAQRHPRGAHAFSHTNRIVFRLTGGRIGAVMLGVPIGLLTTVGRRSGQNRTVPVVYLQDGARYLVVTSNHGFEVPPAWHLNLQSRPEAEFQTRGARQRVVGRELTDGERREVWPRLVEHNPAWGAYQACTERQLAVVALEPLPTH